MKQHADNNKSLEVDMYKLKTEIERIKTDKWWVIGISGAAWALFITWLQSRM